ncbi:MAG: tRNA uridine-5-carboxymethylaminomethyl(34) synthesis GTPase MnmE [Rickettsiales bacterium]
MKKEITSIQDTIFAVSTPIAKSGVSIIRVSGANAKNCFHLFRKKISRPRYAYYTEVIRNEDVKIDDAIVIFFAGPNSFTGEDIIEIHCHGSKAVLNAILFELSTIDCFRMANPGEFAMRSFENGKMDLTQAEGLADLIEAETESQLQQALKQYSGKTRTVINQWREKLIEIMSLVEAYIDFPDEDLPEDLIKDIEDSIDSLKKELNNSIDDNHIGERIRDGFNVAILGEPNAGKSSLMNLLSKREVSIVSEIEGTTRDSIEVHLDIKGFPVIIHDTAGIRKSSDIIEQKGVEIAINKAQSADLKLVIIDSSADKISKELKEIIDKKTIVIFNKIDKANPTINLDNSQDVVEISVKQELNIDKLIDLITNKTTKFFHNYQSSIISRNRYRNDISLCINELNKFSLSKEIELAAEDLRQAANHLGRITGEIDVESILGKIFSSFCIGK